MRINWLETCFDESGVFRLLGKDTTRREWVYLALQTVEVLEEVVFEMDTDKIIPAVIRMDAESMRNYLEQIDRFTESQELHEFIRRSLERLGVEE
jgi:hypothetical protein